MTQDPLIEILTLALRLGLLDIFTCICYQQNGIPSDEILEDLKGRIRAARVRGGEHPQIQEMRARSRRPHSR